MNIGILASGGLGYSTVLSISREIEVQFIATDKGSKPLIDFAKQNNIPIFVGNPRGGSFIDFIDELSIKTDLYFSINYLFLLDDKIINQPKKFCLNIHGSLLPKYRGRAPHVWAIINDEKYTGLTVHKIDTGCDTGPILLQNRLKINENDTGSDILDKFTMLYPKIILEAIKLSGQTNIFFTEQDQSQATYFGRRTPKDGEINWNWFRRRIYNWVRAQAHPYPGAFTYAENNEKWIIDRVTTVESSFSESDPNGLVLGYLNSKPIVKTPNGLLVLETIRGNYYENKSYKGIILGNEDQ